MRVDLGCIIDTAMPCAHGATGMREVGGAVERKAGGPCLVRKLRFWVGGRRADGSWKDQGALTCAGHSTDST